MTNLLYSKWKSMVWRCHRVTSGPQYDDYRGRGIEVCIEWRYDFAAFEAWCLSTGYVHGLTLEREDNDGPYSPGNCKWATPSQQQRNKRNTVMFQGVPLMTFCEQHSIKHDLIRARLRAGYSETQIMKGFGL